MAGDHTSDFQGHQDIFRLKTICPAIFIACDGEAQSQAPTKREARQNMDTED